MTRRAEGTAAEARTPASRSRARAAVPLTGHQLAEHLQVEHRLPHGLVEDGAEPAGAPRHTPAGAHPDRLRLGGQPLGGRHGLAGRVPHRDLEGNGLGVHGGADALVQDAAEAVLHRSAVVMHAGCSLPGSRRHGSDSLGNALLRRARRTLDVPASTGHSSPCVLSRTGE
ncbi:hypothetical protein SGPA1_41034 [Streptomyces misionensis JCM 4497]